jgi:hypothetical protein
LKVKISFKALRQNGCSNFGTLIWQGFRQNSVMLDFDLQNHRMRTLRFEYFGDIWSRYKNEKAHKIYILQAFERIE